MGVNHADAELFAEASAVKILIAAIVRPYPCLARTGSDVYNCVKMAGHAVLSNLVSMKAVVTFEHDVDAEDFNPSTPLQREFYN